MGSTDVRLVQIFKTMEELFKDNLSKDKKGKMDKAKLQEMVTSLETEFEGKIGPKNIEKGLEKHGDVINFRVFAKCVSDLATDYHRLVNQKGNKGGKKGKDVEEDDDEDNEEES